MTWTGPAVPRLAGGGIRDTRCEACTEGMSARFDLVGLMSSRWGGSMVGRTCCSVRTVTKLSSKDVMEFDVWIFCVFHNILLSSDCFSTMSIKFPMYFFPPSSYSIFVHTLLKTLLSVESKSTFFNTIWDTKFYTHTKNLNTSTFWKKSEELRRNWFQDAKNVIWLIYLTPKILPPPEVLRMLAA